MALLGTLLKSGIKLRENLEQEYSTPYELQRKELKELLMAAAQTEFGKQHQFTRILKLFKKRGRDFYEEFKTIPLHDYNKIYSEWWIRSLLGKKNICWPGRVKHFALSSGTSEASSKRIPITKNMTKSIQRTSIRQILSLAKYNLPPSLFESGILMLGGSTHLNKKGSYFEGDLSGILASQIPFWFQHFYKPGKKISRNQSWQDKLDEIVERAPRWDIGILVGVPAWVQILIEKIQAQYKTNHIHDIWPNLMVYVHGGVSLDPYRKGFEKLLGKPIHYIETYLSSEGFIGFQDRPNHSSIKLVLNNGIFYEFIPFDRANFSTSGNVLPQAKPVLIRDVEPRKDYALVISTNAGAWRYLIGDVVRFTSCEDAEIIITGRTKHFLNLCGEHLSVDNMNKAIRIVSEKLNIEIKEYTVAGIPYQNLFAHHWYIGTDDTIDAILLRDLLDAELKKINDDYAVERIAALKEIKVDVQPSEVFYAFMQAHGQIGGQNKFPRVINGSRFEEWKQHVSIF